MSNCNKDDKTKQDTQADQKTGQEPSMITIATAIAHCKPFNANFREASYNAFREGIDLYAGQRTYQLKGAVLLADQQYRVVGKIEAAAVDDWGMVQNASYHLPTERLRITPLQRLYFRVSEILARRAAQTQSRAAQSHNRCATSKRPANTKTPVLSAKSGVGCNGGSGRGESHGVKWTTLRLAG
ncbi:MAG: hypothetical protein HKO07_04250 [Pseudomonadales bacterium]|nr:hypothetical protein [Pseudomonadales bacterium]